MAQNEKNYKAFIEIKEGRKWSRINHEYNTPCFETEDKTEVLERFAEAMKTKFFWKAKFHKTATRRNNYDGTATYVFTFDNGSRITFIIPE